MSAVFQIFVRYQMTLSDNIKISEWESDKNPQAVLEGASLDRGLADKCNTVMLSREFGRIELYTGRCGMPRRQVINEQEKRSLFCAEKERRSHD